MRGYESGWCPLDDDAGIAEPGPSLPSPATEGVLRPAFGVTTAIDGGIATAVAITDAEIAVTVWWPHDGAISG